MTWGSNSQQSLLFLYIISNVLKSGTLLSAAPERHSQNRERRRSATPFFIKRSEGLRSMQEKLEKKILRIDQIFIL